MATQYKYTQGMRISAVIILYHPTRETLLNIRSFYDRVDKLFVFDNTEEGCLIKKELTLLEKVTYHHDARNEGIAKRLNAAAILAVNEGFEWLLMMDQDSVFSNDVIRTYLNCFDAYSNKSETALFGTVWEKALVLPSQVCEPQEAEELIISGTLLNLSLFKRIGPFDEALFIDGVDQDYCIRVVQAGYKIMQFKNILLSHELGNTVRRASIKTLFLIKKEQAIHSPLRCYYIYRNNLYLQAKHKNFDSKRLIAIDAFAKNHIRKCIYYGRMFWKTTRYILIAKRDFKRGKMGKYEA